MGELIEIVRDCENYLGWLPDGPNPWRGRAAAAVRLEKAMTKADPPVTTGDLRLALAWCRRHRQAIKSPSHLLSHVAAAKVHAVVPEINTPIGDRVQAAIAWEMAHTDNTSEDWIGRLVRSSGQAREATLREWSGAGRG